MICWLVCLLTTLCSILKINSNFITTRETAFYFLVRCTRYVHKNEQCFPNGVPREPWGAAKWKQGFRKKIQLQYKNDNVINIIIFIVIMNFT
jgi:hypothetical protein